jgi:hypothetical protein
MQNMFSDASDAQTYVPGLAKGLDSPLYDTLVLTNGPTRYDMFQVQIGGTAPGGAMKTLSDTNAEGAGMIPEGMQFNIHGIGVEFISHAQKATADIQIVFNFLTTAVLSIQPVSSSPLLQTHISRIMNLALFLAVTPTVVGNNELLTVSNLIRGHMPLNSMIPLNGGVHFHNYIDIPAPLGATTIIGDSLRIYYLGEYGQSST